MTTTFEIPTLHSGRLTLRAFRPDDIEPWAAMEGDPEVRRYRGNNLRSRNEAWSAMETGLGQWALRGYGQFALEFQGRFIGFSGILHPPDWPEPELAYSLTRSAWGNGLATEAATAVRDWAFDRHDFARLVSFIIEGNERSAGVARKLGAVRDGTETLRGIEVNRWVHRR